MKEMREFIIIDDDAVNNKICRKILEKTYPNAVITDFTLPVEGFEYIANKHAGEENADKVILLLDIMMPIMDAWNFLEKFETLEDRIKNKFSIYILSSSVSKSDMARAQSNKYVEYYLIKPLTKESIKLIVHLQNKRAEVVS